MLIGVLPFDTINRILEYARSTVKRPPLALHIIDALQAARANTSWIDGGKHVSFQHQEVVAMLRDWCRLRRFDSDADIIDAAFG